MPSGTVTSPPYQQLKYYRIILRIPYAFVKKPSSGGGGGNTTGVGQIFPVKI